MNKSELMSESAGKPERCPKGHELLPSPTPTRRWCNQCSEMFEAAPAPVAEPLGTCYTAYSKLHPYSFANNEQHAKTDYCAYWRSTGVVASTERERAARWKPTIYHGIVEGSKPIAVMTVDPEGAFVEKFVYDKLASETAALRQRIEELERGIAKYVEEMEEIFCTDCGRDRDKQKDSCSVLALRRLLGGR